MTGIDSVVVDRMRQAAPGQAFLYIQPDLGEGRLISLTPRTDPCALGAYLVNVERVRGPIRLVFWDGLELGEFSDIEEACFTIERRVDELRYIANNA